jgi:hypothetical protein
MAPALLNCARNLVQDTEIQAMRGHLLLFGSMSLLLPLSAAIEPAIATESYDFLFDPSRVRDDGEYFLNLAVADSGLPRRMVEPILPRLDYLNVDLPVVLFLSQASGYAPESIVGLRGQGLSWSSILYRLNLPTDILFEGIEDDPGPPYGKAWKYWKRGWGARLSESDVAGLALVQVGARTAGIPPFTLARGRGEGRPVVTAVAEEMGRPYIKEHSHHEDKHGTEDPDGNGRP